MKSLSAKKLKPDHEPRVGIFDGMPIEDYHSHEAISNSGLSHFLRSPAHYIAYRNEPPEPTDRMKFGTAAHFAILEPQLFYRRYVKRPDGANIKTGKGEAAKNRWATSEGKAILAELSEGGAKTVLSEDDFERVERMIEEIYSHPTAGPLFSGGKTEQSAFWRDPDSGVLCRARPDYLRSDLQVDLKTTEDASLSEFSRKVASLGYHRQAAFGMDGLREITGQGSIGWVLVAIETAAPFGIGVYVLDDASIGLGRNEYKGALTRIAECQRSGEWPGYSTDVQALGLPGWYR
jgi:hypothetical protein